MTPAWNRRRVLAGGVAAGLLLAAGRPAWCGATSDLPPALRTIRVWNYERLAYALRTALPGDHILLGTTTYSGPALTMDRPGTAETPIVVRASSVLGPIISFPLQLLGSFTMLCGLSFNAVRCEVGGTGNRLTRCRFSDSPVGAISLLAGQDASVDYCDVTVRPFQPGEAYGERFGLTVISRSDVNIHRNLHVYRNWFHDFSRKPNPSDYWSGFNHPCRIGESGTHAMRSCRALVEYNLFENCLPGSSIVESKTSDNVFRYNTVLNCPGGMMINRTGFRNVYDGNWLQGTNSLRILQGDCIARGNNFEQAIGGMCVMAGDQPYDVYSNNYPQAYNTLVAGNSGMLTVGYDYEGSRTYPALGTRVQQHTGAVVFGLHSGTEIVSTTTEPIPTAFRLSRSEVGPFASGAPDSGPRTVPRR